MEKGQEESSTAEIHLDYTNFISLLHRGNFSKRTENMLQKNNQIMVLTPLLLLHRLLFSLLTDVKTSFGKLIKFLIHQRTMFWL